MRAETLERRVLRGGAVATVAMIAAVLLFFFLAISKLNPPVEPTGSYEKLMLPGDTLWMVATCLDMPDNPPDIRDVVAWMSEENHIVNAEVQQGDRIKIPYPYMCN